MTRPSAFAEVLAAFERGQYDEVLRRTGEILGERPGDDAAHELRARAHLALGQLEDAEREVADAVRLDPDEVRYRELLAEILASRGAHREAAAEFARLAQADPRQADWTVGEARERLDAAQADLGVDAARRAVRLDPASFAAQLALARGLVRVGEARDAEAAARRALALRDDDPDALEALADARWLAGDARSALAAFADLARRRGGPDRARLTTKARGLYRRQAGPLGRALAAVEPLFALALRRGWVHAR